MTEPVAYINNRKDGSTLLTTERIYNDKILGSTPLYSKSQLHPRVKMTQAEFDEFIDLYGNTEGGNGNVYFGLDKAINLESFYPNLNRRLISDNKSNSNFSQVEFANLWIRIDPDTPEETIEIVPDMKWFVISKEKDDGVYYVLGDISKYYSETTTAENDDEIADVGHRFDTKEEAELWTNPLTEAVRLPVEVE